jgi:hypothetical protein
VGAEAQGAVLSVRLPADEEVSDEPWNMAVPTSGSGSNRRASPCQGDRQSCGSALSFSCAELHMVGKLTSFDPPRHFAWQNTEFVIAGLINGLREMAGRDFTQAGDL